MSRESFDKLPAEKRERILTAGVAEFSQHAYADACTDAVTRAGGISKGLLFHYFGSKKAFYLYCLEQAIERLTAETEEPEGEDLYGILFSAMDRKMELCRRRAAETRLVNMASRDASAEIAREKAELFGRYAAVLRESSARTIRRAADTLALKDPAERALAEEGLRLYIGALMRRYLLAYQQTPERFFAESEAIRSEMRSYLDLMLYGICR